MGISASVGTQIPTNVVEVGTEITQPSLDAISSAPSATSVNRFVVLNDLTAKANLSGATFTGKINATPVGGASGVNIGIGGTGVTSVTAGDLWISTGGSSINYRDGLGTWRTCSSNTIANLFTAVQSIEVTATTPALRVIQKGTGNAIEVEDQSPDSTKFIVDQFGKVGIGVVPDANACLKVDANGIMFNDGTVQSTASQGVAGPAGPAGADATAWVYKGAYDGGLTYQPNDFVTLDGSSYVMYNFIGAGGYAPPNYPASWQLVSAVGAQGPQGNDGPQGSNGNDGGSFSDAPYDNSPYIRYNQTWSPLSSWDQTGGGIGDAPQDNNYYVRKDGNWIQCYTTNQYGYNVLYIP